MGGAALIFLTLVPLGHWPLGLLEGWGLVRVISRYVVLTWPLFLILFIIFQLIGAIARRGRLRLLEEGGRFFLGLWGQHCGWALGQLVHSCLKCLTFARHFYFFHFWVGCLASHSCTILVNVGISLLDGQSFCLAYFLGGLAVFFHGVVIVVLIL